MLGVHVAKKMHSPMTDPSQNQCCNIGEISRSINCTKHDAWLNYSVGLWVVCPASTGERVVNKLPATSLVPTAAACSANSISSRLLCDSSTWRIFGNALPPPFLSQNKKPKQKNKHPRQLASASLTMVHARNVTAGASGDAPSLYTKIFSLGENVPAGKG